MIHEYLLQYHRELRRWKANLGEKPRSTRCVDHYLQNNDGRNADFLLAHSSLLTETLHNESIDTSDAENSSPQNISSLTAVEKQAIMAIRYLVSARIDDTVHPRHSGIDEYLKSHPESLLNSTISHIQYLFDVKSIEGLLPRLNQIYLFHEEIRNFLAYMRSSLGIEGSSDSIVLTEIRRRIAEEE